MRISHSRGEDRNVLRPYIIKKKINVLPQQLYFRSFFKYIIDWSILNSF